MKRAAETLVFGALALGAHAAVLALATEADGGAAASGQGGEAQVSLEAASAQVSEMVDRWDTPPAPVEAPQMAAMDAPEPPPAPEAPAAPDMSAPVAPQASQGLALPTTEDAPTLDREATAPPPPPEAEPEPEPEDVQEQEPEPEPEPEPNADPDSAAPLRSAERPQTRPDDLRPPEPEPEPQPLRQAQPEPRQADPEPRQSPSQTTSQSQRASGAGGGSSAGQRQQQQAATLSPSQRQNLARQYGARIRATLERRKRYPGDARGASGTVTVRIVVSRSGQLLGASLISSSGSAPLDRAAIQAVRGARFPAAPDGLRDSQFSFSLPINFSS
ncbi:outer membrane transport energization protein TonB [Roseivivax marinus]|uniref:energy transducer TonB n=1 Tax=Roseivivax marinus TaxID=1379903 RepID=UPI0008BC4858|nr:energy transducer TonB [Roseivivax marinus]SEL95589.1 outer membrane transport energization protein TonB [Roseivivax marinus]